MRFGRPGRSTRCTVGSWPAQIRSGRMPTAFPDSINRMCAIRSAVSNRTSGSKPADRQSCLAQCRDAVPCGSITQGRPAASSSDAGALRPARGGGTASRSASVDRFTRSRSGQCARVCPGYCSASTRSKSRAETSNNPRSGSRSVTSTRRPGNSPASRVSACGIRACAADWKRATRTVPDTVVSDAVISASASSRRSRRWVVCSTSTSACGVSRTRRPTFCSSGTPASFSSRASCWETAEGL